MGDAFFVPDGKLFVPTDWARGPWSSDATHAGPPAGLLGRAVEALDPAGPELLVSRFVMEILRPIPLRPLGIRAEVVRPGKRVQFAQAALLHGDAEIARASVWRIRPSDDLPAAARREAGIGFEVGRNLGEQPFEAPLD